jgi:hypothetical protein
MDKLEFKDSAVWKLLEIYFEGYRKQLMDELRNCPLSEVERVRGRMDALDMVQAYPETHFRSK